jgi:hypothetical protein
MRMRRILCGLGATAIAAALIGCGGPDADVSEAKGGPPPQPPSDIKAKFEKPKKMPPATTKPGG